MIEKLDKFDSTEASIYHVEKLYAKVNEIIDLLNAIVVDVNGTKCVDGSKAPAENVPDKFAEQRR